MRSVVVYASRSGNTRRIAEAIAGGLRPGGPVELLAVDAASGGTVAGTDLLVVGGPTEGHGATANLLAFLDEVDPVGLDGIAVAAFDTRLRWPVILSGSAARVAAARLVAAGGRLVLAPESFLVTMKPELVVGEVERAGRWGAALLGVATPVGAPTRA